MFAFFFIRSNADEIVVSGRSEILDNFTTWFEFHYFPIYAKNADNNCNFFCFGGPDKSPGLHSVLAPVSFSRGPPPTPSDIFMLNFRPLDDFSGFVRNLRNSTKATFRIIYR